MHKNLLLLSNFSFLFNSTRKNSLNFLIYPNKNAPFVAEDNIVVGNVCFYGATGGKAFIRGIAGERFCVRNSGVEAVVEGIGDHGCEYMTGGKIIVLGSTGVNFGAGMSGGMAYIYDIDGDFSSKCNMEMIDLTIVEDEVESLELKKSIEQHRKQTGSIRANEILENWESSLKKFIKVIPTDFKRMLDYIEKAKATNNYKTEAEVIDAAFDMHIANLAGK